jgi:hypothetical protein
MREVEIGLFVLGPGLQAPSVMVSGQPRLWAPCLGTGWGPISYVRRARTYDYGWESRYGCAHAWYAQARKEEREGVISTVRLPIGLSRVLLVREGHISEKRHKSHFTGPTRVR